MHRSAAAAGFATGSYLVAAIARHFIRPRTDWDEGGGFGRLALSVAAAVAFGVGVGCTAYIAGWD